MTWKTKKRVCVEMTYISAATGERHSYYEKFWSLTDARKYIDLLPDRDRMRPVRYWLDLEIDMFPDRLSWVLQRLR